MSHPVFEHDCKTCTFLGVDFDVGGGRLDLYIHVTTMGKSLIVRYGHEGWAYASVPVDGVPADALPGFEEARRLATSRGLL